MISSSCVRPHKCSLVGYDLHAQPKTSAQSQQTPRTASSAVLVPPRPSDAFFVFETAPDKTSVPSARGSAVVDFEKPRFLFFLSRYVVGNAIFSFPKLSSGCSCSLSALYPPELKLGALLLARLYNNSLLRRLNVLKTAAAWREKEGRRARHGPVFAFLSRQRAARLAAQRVARSLAISAASFQ